MRTSKTQKLEISVDVKVADCYAIMGVIYAHNGCCKDKPYLLTGNKIAVSKTRPEGINYSCQCACGMWCTNGHGTPGGAIDEYEEMTRRYEREHENEI